jgi:chemotaxis protein MotB
MLFSLNSCVPAKKYEELKNKYNQAEQNQGRLERKLEDYKRQESGAAASKSELQNQTKKQAEKLERLTGEKSQLQKQLDQLQDSYDALEKNSSSAMAANSQQNRELLKDLEKKQANLQKEQQRLEKMKTDLQKRSQRVEELETLIAKKDAKMKNLKDEVVAALTDFQGKGLSVEQRNGKVYVSMENKLLFSSGSYSVNAQGRKAVSQLAGILEQNADINVLIEGHTDNVQYNGKGTLKDNWDLSTKRATSIVHLLMKNSSINAKRLTAAGRSKFAPVASNATESGRAKNRRIEVILTPKLDQLDRILSGME